MKRTVVDAKKLLNWINGRIESLGVKKSRENCERRVLRETKAKILEMRTDEKAYYSQIAKKGSQVRDEKLEPYYDYILPIIERLQKEGKTTAYAITNALNAMGEKTVRGRAFRDVITSRLMKKLRERQTQIDLVNYIEEKKK